MSRTVWKFTMPKLTYRPPLLTYRQAAKKVNRSIRAIHRWRRAGMPMGWQVRNGQRVRVVREDVLLEWLRRRLANNPAHQYRLRKTLAADHESDTPNLNGACIGSVVSPQIGTRAVGEQPDARFGRSA